MSSSENNMKNETILKAVSIFTESINNTKLSGIDDLFNFIVKDSEVDILKWEIKDYDQFLNDIDPISKCQDDMETEEDSLITKKYISNLFISLISVLQDIQSNDIANQIYSLVTKYIHNKTNGHIESTINYIMPSNKKDLLNVKSTAIITILISSLKALLNPNDKDMKELLQNIFQHINNIEIEEDSDKTNNSEYLNFMLSLFSELFGDLELDKVIKLIWEVTDGNTEQIAEYISYLLYEYQVNSQKEEEEEEEGVESKHFGLATRIVIEKYIEPLQQKQRRQIIRNRNKTPNENASANTAQTEEEAANADLNEIYSFIKQVLHHTCLDDVQNGYPKELALFFSSFKDFWEPDSIIKFIMSNEVNDKSIEENYKEYYGPFLMDLADLMDWTNKQCESALSILTKGWKKSNRISIAKMMGLSLNDIKHLYSDCKDITYNDPDYLSDAEENNQDNQENENNEKDQSKTKKPVVLSIRGSDFKRTFTKPLTDKDNVSGTVCRYYGTPRGCSAGKHCPYKHIQTSRSSYISRRLNHSMYANSSYNSRFGSSNSRYLRTSNINRGVKHRSSYQNMNSYRGSTRNPSMDMNNNDMSKNRINNRVSTYSSNDLKYGKKGDRKLHEKYDSYGKKDIPLNHHKLRKHASFINPPSYRSQTSKEYKPIEAIDPAIPHHSHSNTICHYYNDPRGCSNGKNCKFLHIHANNYNGDNHNFDGRNNHSYENNRKSFNSPYKSYSGNGNNYTGSYNETDSMNKGHIMNRKSSRHMLKNSDPKLKSEYSNYKKNGNEDDKSTTVNDNDNSSSNPASITIVNSSQTNSNVNNSSTNKTENNKEFNNANKTTTPSNFNGQKAYSQNQTPCVFFSKEGTCKYGDNCKFLHVK
ncbi:hypothetical protein BCR36DRAFT_361055 [Piromyces finnis]|uniref:C3H1-type domain-containing protein n=1 Tax=Piromyces finnis TaxID=1754191 RepID=A0A1Y1V0K5_9FUNG|nr:hypothetical protein BCR36DRAFT_361055 [Piromyces finnis]|eukprot:ORX43389.1 hypothetical protein BCR36DRAFT_361055 [Piromyces finnis]